MTKVAMDGLDYFLGFALDYEINHQLILFDLLEHLPFREALLGISDGNVELKLEPERGSFDIGLKGESAYYLIEIKTGSGTLGHDQILKQSNFLLDPKADRIRNGVYVLLGYSSFEHDLQTLSSDLASPRVDFVSYERLIASLEKAHANLSGDSEQLAIAYTKALKVQHQNLLVHDPSRSISWLPLYSEVRTRTKDIRTRIYRDSNASGTVSILNAREWKRIGLGPADDHTLESVDAQLYVEFNNGRLFLKIETKKLAQSQKYRVRELARRHGVDVLREVNAGIFTKATGRIGAYMSALVIGDETLDASNIDLKARLFCTAHGALDEIASRMQDSIEEE